jgi:hypothetical protein
MNEGQLKISGNGTFTVMRRLHGSTRYVIHFAVPRGSKNVRYELNSYRFKSSGTVTSSG